ncbi:hypothetical protein, partial [Gemmatimonas sp.]|uniref:hypothetical protein n=1 Tax=Gemmatimonas sp. TaxID=1962908 RepID=UPI00333FC86C
MTVLHLLLRVAFTLVGALLLLAACSRSDAASIDSATSSETAASDVANDGAAPVSLPVSALEARDGDLILR